MYRLELVEHPFEVTTNKEMLSYGGPFWSNHDNKIAPQVNFNTTAANIMDVLCIFVITKQYFFNVLVIFLATRVIFVLIIRNTFFIHAMNYFSVVLRIIFQLGRELFFAVSRIYFLVYNALRALYLKWTGSSL